MPRSGEHFDWDMFAGRVTRNISRNALAEIIQCAVKGVDVQRELIPPGNLLFQPVAIGAAVEVIRRGGSEPSMERVALATPRVNRP